MILIIIAAIILFPLSPFISMTFFTNFGGKYLFDNKKRIIVLGLLALITAYQIIMKIFPTPMSLYMFLGLGVSISLFFEFQKKKNFYESLMNVSIVSGVSVYLISRIFKEEYKNALSNSVTTINGFLSQTNKLSEGQSTDLKAAYEKFLSYSIDFQLAIWTISIILALYIGILLYAKRNKLMLNHRLIQTPDYLVFVLIADLILLILFKEKKIFINILLILLSLYMISGISVLDFFWRRYFRNNRFRLVLLIVIMILNPYFLLLISLVGIFDYWFNFRKIGISEEK